MDDYQGEIWFGMSIWRPTSNEALSKKGCPNVHAARLNILVKSYLAGFLIVFCVRIDPVPAEPLVQKAQTVSSAADLLNEAGRKLSSGDARGALTDVDAALKIDPKRAYSYSVRALCKDSIGDHSGALADLNRAIDLEPDGDPAIYLQRAITNYGLDRYDDCLRDCDIVIKRVPEMSLAYRFRAQANVAKGYLKSALVDCDLYLKANPDDDKAAQFRKRVLADMHRGDEEIARGWAMAKGTSPIRLKNETQTFSFGVHKFDLLPPKNSSLQEVGGTPPCEHMKMFLFSSPKDRFEKSSILEVIIVTPTPGESPTAQKLLDSIINPYRKRLANYVEESDKQMVVDGLQFRGVHFSGSLGADEIRGFAFAGGQKDILYVLTGQGPAKSFEETMKTFAASLKTCKFHY